MAVPRGVTWPQRSASCHRSASTRFSTPLSCEIAWVSASRFARSVTRSTSIAWTSGKAATLWAKPWSSTRTGRLQHRPAHLGLHEPRRTLVLPRAQQVAGAEQLGGDVVAEQQLTRDHPVEHEQPELLRSRPQQPLIAPRSGRHRVQVRHERARRSSARSAESSAPRSGSASRTRTPRSNARKGWKVDGADMARGKPLPFPALAGLMRRRTPRPARCPDAYAVAGRADAPGGDPG